MYTWYSNSFKNIKTSQPEVFHIKDILKNFAKLTGKQLCWSHLFNKFAELRPATLLKKKL